MRGVSLIELMVGIAVFSVALMLGIPTFGEWIANAQIRSTGESLQNGLNFARAEAVRRNTIVRFQLTSTLDNNCTLSTTGKSWVVNMSQSVAPTQLCAASVSDASTPFLIQQWLCIIYTITGYNDYRYHRGIGTYRVNDTSTIT